MDQLADENELKPGDRKSVFVDDTPALLIRIDDDYYVIEDVCSHDGQPLTEGTIENCAIRCPRHGARFDLKTGHALCMPATTGIQTFDVVVKDGAIYAQPTDHSEVPEGKIRHD